MKYIIKRIGRSVEISDAISSLLVYRIPYQNLSSGADKMIKIKNRFIVYILFGENNGGQDVVYVGKSTNGLKNRPTSHDDKFDNWTYCYVLTQHEERTFLNDGTIQYIEDKVNKRVKELKHYQNTTKVTSAGTANNYDIEDCDEYLCKAYEMLDVLGLDLITYMDNDASDMNDAPDDTASGAIPDGVYTMSWKLRRWGNKTAKGKMQVVGGKYIILAGSDVCPNEGHGLVDSVRLKRESANIVDDKLQEDIVLDSPSGAASFVTGAAANGWSTWRTGDGQMIDIFRNDQQFTVN